MRRGHSYAETTIRTNDVAIGGISASNPRLSMGTLKPNKSEHNSTATLREAANGAKVPRNESKKSIRQMISRWVRRFTPEVKKL